MPGGATQSPCRAACRGLALLAGVALAAASGAADWRFTPRFSANEVYSDNINLSPSGQERDDFITTLNAGASVRGTGRRITVNLDYNAQHLRYENNSSADATNQQWQAGGTAELVEQIVFLEARSTLRQENVSSTARADSTNLALTGNTTDVLTYSVTPIVRHHFGGIGDAEARYQFSTVDTDGNAGSGDTTNITARLSSGREFPRLPWSVSTTRRRIENDSGTESRFSSVEGTVRYKFTRQYGVVASAGYDRNDFATSGNDSGVRWSVGGTWTPTPRTSVEAGFQSRFFSNGYFLNASHRSRRMVFTANYREDITTSSQTLLDRELIPLVDAFGEPVVDRLTGDQVELPIFRETLTEEVQVDRTLRGSASYRGRRNSATISVFNTNREFQVSGDEEQTFGVSLSGSRRLSRDASVSVNGSWTRQNPPGAGGGSTQWQLGSSMSYRVSRDINAVVDIRRLTRTTSAAANDYDEHRASLRVNVSF